MEPKEKGELYRQPSVLYMFHREAGQLMRELELMKETLPYYDRIAKGHGAGAEHICGAILLSISFLWEISLFLFCWICSNIFFSRSAFLGNCLRPNPA